MTIARGLHFGGFGETHLMPDAIVAFVDDELSGTACERARAHLRKCALCAHEASTQREARNDVRGADLPSMPAGLLASLHDIPQDAELPPAPDGLAVTESGQLVFVQRPDRAAAMLGQNPLGPRGAVSASKRLGSPNVLGAPTALGSSKTLGASAPLGTAAVVHGSSPLGTTQPIGERGTVGKRAVQGAGVLVSGVMLGALALATPHSPASTQIPAPSAHGASGAVATVGLRTPLRMGARAIHGMMVARP
jgi:hypothetical protein